MSDSLRPHELQHTRLPYPSLFPGVFSDSCPLSQWCHPTISSSVIPFSSCPQSFPASGSSSRSQFFTSGGQSIGASALASVLPMNIQGWSPLGGTLKSSAPQFQSISSPVLNLLYGPTLTSVHGYWKNHSLLWIRRKILRQALWSLSFYSKEKVLIAFVEPMGIKVVFLTMCKKWNIGLPRKFSRQLDKNPR